MKKTTPSQTMRQVAGWLYLVLCVFQMLSLYAAWNNAITGIFNSWIFEMGLVLLYGAAAVYMIAGKATLKQPVRRGIVIATVLAVAFALVTYQTQLMMYDLFFQNVLPNTSVAVIWQVVLLIVRLVLLILAAFFVSSSTEDADSKETAEAAVKEEMVVDYVLEDDEGNVAIVEETVTVTEEPAEENKD